jgi:hypothetical protein
MAIAPQNTRLKLPAEDALLNQQRRLAPCRHGVSRQLRESGMSEWIGADLEGTLAETTEREAADYMGHPLVLRHICFNRLFVTVTSNVRLGVW